MSLLSTVRLRSSRAYFAILTTAIATGLNSILTLVLIVAVVNR